MKPLTYESLYEAQALFTQQFQHYLKQHQHWDSQFQWGEMQTDLKSIILAVEISTTCLLTLTSLELAAFLPDGQNVFQQNLILKQKASELVKYFKHQVIHRKRTPKHSSPTA